MTDWLKQKIAGLGPWERAEFWVGLSESLADHINGQAVIARFENVLHELKSAVKNREVKKIENIAERIEGEREKDSWIVQCQVFEEGSKENYIQELFVGGACFAINTLFVSGHIHNVPGPFKEKFGAAELANNALEIASKGGVYDVVERSVPKNE